MRIHIYIYICLYVYIYTYTHEYVYIYTCTYITCTPRARKRGPPKNVVQELNFGHGRHKDDSLTGS